jgi:hypothetical protein
MSSLLTTHANRVNEGRRFEADLLSDRTCWWRPSRLAKTEIRFLYCLASFTGQGERA